MWTSRALHSDLMLLLARTTPLAEVEKKTQGLSVFLIDIHEARKNGMDIRLAVGVFVAWGRVAAWMTWGLSRMA